jgi:hypothetical protein
MKISRRQFLGGGGYALLASLGYVLPGFAQKEGENASTRSLVDLFEADFRGYGYDRYLHEAIEKARRGGIQGGGSAQWVAGADEKKLLDFRSAWGIEGRYAIDWRSLSSMSVGKPADDSGITRVKFDLDCGFPVVALIGKRVGPSKGIVLLLHGMGTTPERTLGLGEADYMRHIGRRLIEQGYTVICPFFFLMLATLSPSQKLVRCWPPMVSVFIPWRFLSHWHHWTFFIVLKGQQLIRCIVMGSQ